MNLDDWASSILFQVGGVTISAKAAGTILLTITAVMGAIATIGIRLVFLFLRHFEHPVREPQAKIVSTFETEEPR